MRPYAQSLRAATFLPLRPILSSCDYHVQIVWAEHRGMRVLTSHLSDGLGAAAGDGQQRLAWATAAVEAGVLDVLASSLDFDNIFQPGHRGTDAIFGEVQALLLSVGQVHPAIHCTCQDLVT